MKTKSSIAIIVMSLLVANCGGGGGGVSGDPVENAIATWRVQEQACDTLPLREDGAKVDPQEVLRVLRQYGTILYRTEQGPEHYETACEVQARGWADCEGQSAYGYRALREYNRWSDWDLWLVQAKVDQNGQTWRHTFLKVGPYAFDPNNERGWQAWDYNEFVKGAIVENIFNQWG